MSYGRGVKVAFCVVLVAAFAFVGGGSAHADGTTSATYKSMCAPARPASKRGPFAQCDAWAKVTSTGRPSKLKGPSKAAKAAAAKGTPTITSSPTVVQQIWAAQLSGAYGLPTTTAGSGTQTVGIVDAWGDPRITQDLAQMDSDFFSGFPTCTGTSGSSCFAVVNQTGGASPLPSASCPQGTLAEQNDCLGWSIESALDVQTVHIICRDCKIILVEANSDSFDDLAAAENEAVALGANIVSNSFGTAESGFQQSDFDTYAPDFEHAGVLTLASTGDSAFESGTQFPADINSVVAVGGTTLSTNGTNTDTDSFGPVGYVGETAWFTAGSPPSGAGSGCSVFQSPQVWQSGAIGWAATGCGTERAVADVSADANPSSGLRVFDSDPLLQSISGCAPADDNCYFQIGGTSLAAPLIAATYALAANPNTVANLQSLPYAHFRSLHDVTSGSTGSCGNTTICRAAAGYDGPTGIGTPNGLLGFEIGTPTISSFNPTAGPAGTTVTIKGQSFTQASAVTVGGTPVQSFTVDSDIQITAVVGDGTTGTIQVTTPGGTATSSGQFQFAPTISSFTPKGGGAGTSVTITGAGFGGATAVAFGGTPAAHFTVDSDTQITATTASGTNTGPITVTGAGGTATSSGNFYGPPTISSVSPGHAGVHGTVVVRGTNLTGASRVTVNGANASFTVVSTTKITLTVPSGASASGTIVVTTPGGDGSSGAFTVDPGPAITSFNPGNGAVGQTITITGTNLGGTVAVKLGKILTVPVTVSSTTVTFTIPPGAVTGTITVLSASGSATSSTPLTIG